MSSYDLYNSQQNLNNAGMLFSQNMDSPAALTNLLGAQMAHSWAVMADDDERRRKLAAAANNASTSISRVTRDLERERREATAAAERVRALELKQARESAEQANKKVADLTDSLQKMLALPIGTSVLFKNKGVVGALASRDALFELALIDTVRPWVKSHHAVESLARQYGTRLGLSPDQMHADFEAILSAPCADQAPPPLNEHRTLEPLPYERPKSAEHPNRAVQYETLLEEGGNKSLAEMERVMRTEFENKTQRATSITVLTGIALLVAGFTLYSWVTSTGVFQ